MISKICILQTDRLLQICNISLLFSHNNNDFLKLFQVSILTLGNKLDLSNRRQVESVQALNWASREKIKLHEVSSLDRESLKEPFIYLSSKLNPPPNKSSFSQHLTIGRKQPKTSES